MSGNLSKLGSSESVIDVYKKNLPKSYHSNFKEKFDTHTSESDWDDNEQIEFHKADVVG